MNHRRSEEISKKKNSGDKLWNHRGQISFLKYDALSANPADSLEIQMKEEIHSGLKKNCAKCRDSVQSGPGFEDELSFLGVAIFRVSVIAAVLLLEMALMLLDSFAPDFFK